MFNEIISMYMKYKRNKLLNKESCESISLLNDDKSDDEKTLYGKESIYSLNSFSELNQLNQFNKMNEMKY